MYLIGLDIGGTKCAVSLGALSGGERLTILEKIKFPTEKRSPEAVLQQFLQQLEALMKKHALCCAQIAGIGVSCGGPLDSRRGVVLSPPNLPGWDEVHVTRFFTEHTGLPCWLQNDANACAVAEWKYGAGKGCENMVFLTFGTGLGAGVILNGHLYSGSTDNAGEIGHVRLTPDGPVGYRKAGSAEGWCSGGGLAQIGRYAVQEALRDGKEPLLWLRAERDEKNITAKLIGDLAEQENDPLCLDIYRTCGERLGQALSILIDLLDPDLIVLGGIYMRSAALLRPHIERVIGQEALHGCPIAAAGLGEQVGDYAALSIAAMNAANA